MTSNEASTGQQLRPPERLERFIIDTDVNARLVGYLRAIGFDVVLASQVNVNIHDDVAILRWARGHHRFFVCHDKFKDGQTRIRMRVEVYNNGGQIIRIGGKPNQHPLTSLGKILAQRMHWLDFFQKNGDGMVVVHEQGMRSLTRDDLYRDVQRTMIDPTDALMRPRKTTTRARRPPKRVPEQLSFIPTQGV